MHRRPLLELLAAYVPHGPGDDEARRRIHRFVEERTDCFERTLAEGHVTGSAWIVDPSRTRCLLTHHRKLDRWLQLGGHADGQADVAAVALREAREESGLASVRLLSPAVFDCDVHWIPPRKAEAGHWHYDVRFLVEADPGEALVISEESKDLAWVEMAALFGPGVDESVARMARRCPAARS